eukprot:TRINITY_DN1961_c0_g1_i1.p2 TRINITY_DN1961_c0_g1~~TRINITY_DN1961_c0_g1_i1.p2  ORF type:complete len:254 (-),score=-11.94 TRINITY_DN1961_c0_g1_i1:3134-3895(-)
MRFYLWVKSFPPRNCQAFDKMGKQFGHPNPLTAAKKSVNFPIQSRNFCYRPLWCQSDPNQRGTTIVDIIPFFILEEQKLTRNIISLLVTCISTNNYNSQDRIKQTRIQKKFMLKNKVISYCFPANNSIKQMRCQCTSEHALSQRTNSLYVILKKQQKQQYYKQSRAPFHILVLQRIPPKLLQGKKHSYLHCIQNKKVSTTNIVKISQKIDKMLTTCYNICKNISSNHIIFISTNLSIIWPVKTNILIIYRNKE